MTLLSVNYPWEPEDIDTLPKDAVESDNGLLYLFLSHSNNLSAAAFAVLELQTDAIYALLPL